MTGSTMGVARSLPWVGRESSFTRDAVVNFAGTILARAITFASMAVVTRIYAPADLGVWAIVLTLSSFLLPLATLRYDVAIVIASSRRSAAALVLVIGASTLLIVTCVAFILWTAPISLLEGISGLDADKQGLLRLVPLVLALLAGQAMLHAWLTRSRRFGTSSLAQLVQAVVTAAATLLLPLVAGASGAVAAASAMLGLSAALLFVASSCAPEILALMDRRMGLVARSVILRFKVYPLYLVPYSLSAGLAERVLQVVLAGAYSISTLGAFYVARQLVTAPAVLIAESLRQVHFAHSARERGAAMVKERVARVLRLLIDVQSAGLAFALFWLTPILAAVAGRSWARLGDFVWWTLFPASTYLLVGWLDRMLDVFGRQRLAVAIQLASDVVLIGIALVSPGIGLGDVGMIAALSIGKAIMDVIWLVVTLELLHFGVVEVSALVARACGLCLLWSGLQFTLAAFMPGPPGLVAACGLLALSFVPLIGKLGSSIARTR